MPLLYTQQYKGRETFAVKRQRVIERKKNYLSYYGSAGHDRALVDGMSSCQKFTEKRNYQQ